METRTTASTSLITCTAQHHKSRRHAPLRPGIEDHCAHCKCAHAARVLRPSGACARSLCPQAQHARIA
eukprot:11267570-Alexandrium_andersonii.AAC.1